MENNSEQNSASELEWINIRRDVDNIFNEETVTQKFIRKFKETPLVPIGCFATVVCLGCGLYNLRSGNSVRQQIFMRGRVLAQGFTIAAFILGLMFNVGKKN
ncbi:HIG1 domain family member 2A, mitochondrial-like [Lycorma delicatula]|uniref:HIG1 domain family member 2A, mitochondrial-like n=1 Tax=Lycorma delicatula TaxID=130591 RepID=UPI003F5145CD